MILLALATVAAWTPASCDENDARVCATRDLATAERAMETELRAAIDRMKNCRPADSTGCYNIPHAIKLIETEQTTWLAWRNAHCDVLAFGVEETSAEAQVRADCRTKLTVERTGELAKVRND